MNKKYRMIYLADSELLLKIKEMRKKYHMNISSLIREFLENKYKEIKENERK